MDNIQTPQGTETVEGETSNTPQADGTPAAAPEQVTLTKEEAEALKAKAAEADTYKQKFSESSREAQIWMAKAKQNTQIPSQDNPTEEDLKARYRDWDDLNDVAKEALRQTYLVDKRIAKLEAEREEERAKRQFDNDVEAEILKNSKLLGKESDYRSFVSKQSHRGAPLDLLTELFLAKQTDTPTPAPKTALQSGSGGPKEVKSKWTADSAMELMKKDPRQYQRLVEEGEIRIDDFLKDI